MTGIDGRSRHELRRTTAPHCCASARARRRMQSPFAPSISASIASAAGATTPRWSRTLRARLQRLGSQRGERVAIMGDVCEEWMICDLAAQSLGAIVYGIYPTASAAEVEYQMRDGGACDLHRRGPGICRQDPADRRPPAGSARDRGDRRFRDVRLRASEAASLCRAAGRRGRRPDLAWLETQWRRSRRTIRPSSSTPPAPPAIRRAR